MTYRVINPLQESYDLLLRKRKFIPEIIYRAFVYIFGDKLGTKTPFRWLLHKETKE
jgi:hypothetical protein